MDLRFISFSKSSHLKVLIFFIEGACEVEDGGNNSLRDRSKKERPSRRRRLSSNENYHVDRDEVEDGSSDESLDEDHEDEDEPARGGGSGGNLSLRRTTRGKPQWKVNLIFTRFSF